MSVRSAAIAATVTLLGAYWVVLASGVRSSLIVDWGYLAFMTGAIAVVTARAVRVRADRLAWGALSAGMMVWTIATLWLILEGSPLWTPSVKDALWLSVYPASLLTFGLLARPWLRRAHGTLALDTLSLVFVGTALVTAFVVPQVLEAGRGMTWLERTVNLAYPIGDGVLVMVAVIGAAVTGRRANATWLLLAVSSFALVAGDAMWAAETADGTWGPIVAAKAIYPVWPILTAIAATLPAPRRPQVSMNAGAHAHAAALAGAVAAMVLLTANEWLDVPAPSVVLAALGLLLAVHRSALALAAGLRDTFAAARERELVDDVRAGLQDGELELYFQPLVDTRTGAVRGAEALLRWRRADGLVPPDRFLPAVERSELMAPLTDFVLDQALAAAAGWHAAGREIGISVNLATANLSEPDLPARVLAALRRHAVDPSALTLEITETAAVADSAMAVQVLSALDEAGIAISVDDFGTGHSSLVRLARFPIRELKIDRSFVRDMHTAAQPIVATAIQLAQALGLRVVAEGIEDAATLDALRGLGCDVGQGYFISRPLAGAEFAAWLAAADCVRADLAVETDAGRAPREAARTRVPITGSSSTA